MLNDPLKMVHRSTDNGWDGAEVLFTRPDERIRRERKAYGIEIQMAKENGWDDIAEELERLLDEEIRRIENGE